MESDIEMPCPICTVKGKLKMISHVDEIPYFGEHTQVTILCGECGWRQTDFIPAEGRKPGAWSITIAGDDVLRARVVRSSSCTIRIPELDLEVKPGAGSSGYVSNVEGVLNRFIEVVDMVARDLAADEILDDLQRCMDMKTKLLELKEGGQGDITLELLDPRGHSQILHADAENRELSESELAELPLGPDPPVLDG